MNLDRIVAGLLDTIPARTREHFAADPLRALQSTGLTVEAVDGPLDSRAEGGLCDGTSFLDDRVVLYRPTPSSRRENFTFGHELGHYVVDRDEALMDWLADQQDPMLLIETLCDRIAAALLLPTTTVQEAMGNEPISSVTVLDLFERSLASRPACAIAIAAKLPHLGAAVILDPATATVTFSSVRPDPDQGWPAVIPWAGQAIPAGHPLKTLTPGARFTRKSFWESPWGKRESFYIDAVHDGRRIIAICSDTDLWNCEKLHVDTPREYSARPVRTVICCGTRAEVRGYPCATCGGGYCKTCGRCKCQKATQDDQQCRSCFMLYKPYLLVDGRCENCR